MPEPSWSWSERDLHEAELNHREEVSSEWMYRALAERDRRPGGREMFLSLAGFEHTHAALWEGLLRKLGRAPPPSPRPLWNHRILVQMARWLGVGSVMAILHREEVDGVDKYREQADRWKDPRAQEVFRQLLPDEVAHEIETFNSARSEAAGSGSLRSILLGAIDGFGSIVALAAGVAGITANSRTVLIAGSAALIAGALSMAASEYVSSKAEGEVGQAQARMERDAMNAAPDLKRRQLTDAYVEKGLSPSQAEEVVGRVSRDPNRFLKALLAERLGLGADEGEDPLKGGLLTGVSFALAGGLPLVPYLLLPAVPGAILSVALTGTALFLAGIFRALSSLQPFLRSGGEMLLVGLGSAAATYLIGLGIGGVVGG